MQDIPASTTIVCALIPLERGLSRNAATFAASDVSSAWCRSVAFSAKRYASMYPGIPADALVFRGLAPTALTLMCGETCEVRDFARKTTLESRAALTGPLYGGDYRAPSSLRQAFM